MVIFFYGAMIMLILQVTIALDAFAIDCLLTGQEQACSRIIWLVVRLGVNTQEMVADCSIVITSIGEIWVLDNP